MNLNPTAILAAIRATSKARASVNIRPQEVRSVVIANGQSLSAEVDLQGLRILAIIAPAAWTAAAMSFQASDVTAGTFVDVYGEAGELSIDTGDIPTAASRFLALDVVAAKLDAVRFIKLRSGLSAAAVNQVAARTIKLVLG